MADRVQGTSKIDFFGGQASGVDELSGAHRLMVNLVRQPMAGAAWGSLIPGTSAWSWAPTAWPNTNAVIGMTDFDGKLIYVTADRKFYAVEAPGLVTARSDATAATQLQGAERPSFAVAKTQLFVAGGGLISYWDGAAASFAQVSGVDAPIAGFVAANSQRIIATPFGRSGQFRWTDPFETSHVTGWDPINFAEAEARPDKAVAVHENSNYIYVFGTRTHQAFSPDANVGYSPVSTVNVGTAAPHSVINMLEDKLFAWFSNTKEFVVGDGHTQPKSISGEMTSVFQELPTWADCRGYRAKINGADLLIWTFPTTGQTFAYNLKHSHWLEPRGYDSGLGTWAPWPITSYFYWEDYGFHLVGLSDGSIQVLDPGSTTVAGQIIKGESIVGFNSQGIEGREKQTDVIAVPIRRGEVAYGSTAPIVLLSYRDSPGAWSQPIPISLGVAGDRRPLVKKDFVGRPYFRRQWRLEVANGAGLSLGPVEETFTVMGF